MFMTSQTLNAATSQEKTKVYACGCYSGFSIYINLPLVKNKILKKLITGIEKEGNKKYAYKH